MRERERERDRGGSEPKVKKTSVGLRKMILSLVVSFYFKL
jgi:hypothetical protein